MVWRAACNGQMPGSIPGASLMERFHLIIVVALLAALAGPVALAPADIGVTDGDSYEPR